MFPVYVKQDHYYVIGTWSDHPGLTVQPHAIWLWLGQLIRIVSKLTTLPWTGAKGVALCRGIAQSSWGSILE